MLFEQVLKVTAVQMLVAKIIRIALAYAGKYAVMIEFVGKNAVAFLH